MTLRLLGNRNAYSFRRRLSALAVCAILLAGAAPLAAQEEGMAEEAMAADAMAGTLQVQTTSMTIPEAPDLVIEDGAIRLQLEDALAIAISRNLDIAVERYSREQSLLGIQQTKGIYDLTGTLGFSIGNSDSPSVSQVEGVPVVQDDDRGARFTLNQLTPFGGQASFDLVASRNATNSVDQLVNPRYFASGELSFVQPLLRNFGRLATEEGIIRARLGSSISRETFEQQVANVLELVERAYWGLVEAREQLVVAQESLKLAQDLHERNRIQVDVGTLAPIELVQSEATISQRQEGIITSEARLRDAADEVLRLLNLPDLMAQGLDVVPLTDPETEKVDIDVDEAIRTALEERPELRSQRLEVERLDVSSRFRRNQKLPGADVSVTYDSSGIGGRGQLPISETEVLNLDTDLSDAFQSVYKRDFTGWSIGLSLSYPLQNRVARANSVIANLALQQGQTQLSQLELSITTEVRSAARAVRTAAQQIESARATRNLQQRNLEAEQKRYENGMSDSFRIAQIQNDLTEARSREVTAVTNYRTSLVAYQRAIGRLLEDKGVELVGPEDEEPMEKSRFSLFG